MQETKVCVTCGEEKVLGEFSLRSDTGYLRTSCKDCRKDYLKKYYKENKKSLSEKQKTYRENNKFQIAESKKEYRKNNINKIVEHKKEYYEINKEYILGHNKKYRQTENSKENRRKASKLQRLMFPKEHSARTKLNTAIRDGKIERGVCSVCGTNKNVEGHHLDYNKPLDVVWLCMEHHKAVHREIKLLKPTEPVKRQRTLRS